MYRPTTLTTLSVLFLSALATPMPFGDSLDKRDTYTGTGRPYYPQAGKVACGTNVDFSHPIVAISHDAFEFSNYCNRGIIVTNTANGNAAYARIGDECQQHECAYYDLDLFLTKFLIDVEDLPEKLFAQLGGTDADMEINWYPVAW
ncbi:hypothetical protein EV363DRAFT_1165606 [Boletus edulis]|uniref:Uncharacterized protein n=1 Tax=Boletus edulis BED1 TaxID=1328754 RepID=A0AAD4C7Y0_BOLED|nr:hypothetical protein EV363DRAFT_1165606 [Boletus edulis]KAF8451166.1 hypothetical protein L210DRAFT_3500334 [Boletus edulis BED1]